MKNIYVEIHGIADMTNFIKEATNVYGDVTCRKGKYVVDAKSIMGVMSIDISTGVTVEYPEDAADFENFIKEFAV